MPQLLNIILLAGCLFAIAHGRNMWDNNLLSDIRKPILTSSFYNVRVARDASEQHPILKRLKLTESVAVRTPSSVVQDWSLVCKQLCGVGLGGVPCTAYCSAHETPTLGRHRNADKILSMPTGKQMCQDLCELQLGGVVCDCDGNVPIKATIANDDDLDHVCNLFCDHNHVTLNGCSPCDAMAMNGYLNNDVGKLMAVQAADGNSNNDNDDDDTVYPEAPQNVAPVESATTVSTTTPNWNELCATLCKTGDGGSLCNCDLSPFYF